MHQPEGDVDAPALPARQLGQVATLETGEVEARRQFGDAGVGGGLAHALEAGLDDELLADAGAGGRDPADLGDVADAAADLTRLAQEVGAGHGGRAGRRGEQRRQHPQRGRLAGAVGSEQADDLAGGDVEVDALHGVDRSGLGRERLREATSGDHGGSLVEMNDSDLSQL